MFTQAASACLPLQAPLFLFLIDLTVQPAKQTMSPAANSVVLLQHAARLPSNMISSNVPATDALHSSLDAHFSCYCCNTDRLKETNDRNRQKKSQPERPYRVLTNR